VSESESHDAALRAFKAVAAERAALSPICVASLYEAVTNTADDMRRAGQPIERVIAHVKALASEAGVRESHDCLVTSAVLWAIDYYYSQDGECIEPVDPREVAARLRSLLASDDRASFQPWAGVKSPTRELELTAGTNGAY
jgi:hypothetical protein